MTHVFHQTKFRWTENLTSRFIQLRKENGNLFTGRKYSAQAGWEHILQKMRQEFPTIMADVHYRVLKKKWSNLLQQYKELKNPVHGDKNKSDDVSWPFYSAIDEVLGYNNQSQEDDEFNPHEFLCLSVTPDEPASSPEDEEEKRRDSDADYNTQSSVKRIKNLNEEFSIQIERLPKVTISRREAVPPPSVRGSSQLTRELRRHEASEVLVSRLPPATELSIKTVRPSPLASGLRVRKSTNNKYAENNDAGKYLRKSLVVNRRNGNNSVCSYNDEVQDLVEREEEAEYEAEEEDEVEEDYEEDEEKQRPRKLIKRVEGPPTFNLNDTQRNLEKRLSEFLEYTKRRDEENRIIMTRILNAVERIADKNQ